MLGGSGLVDTPNLCAQNFVVWDEIVFEADTKACYAKKGESL